MTDKALSSLTDGGGADTGDVIYAVRDGNSRQVNLSTMVTSSGVRELLTANLSVYVNASTGSDSNTGGASDPFLTLQAARNYVQRTYDLAYTYTVTFECSGEFTASVHCNGKLAGQVGPANEVWNFAQGASVAGGDDAIGAFATEYGGQVTLQAAGTGATISASGTEGVCIGAGGENSIIDVATTNITVNCTGAYALYCGPGGQLFIISITIQGDCTAAAFSSGTGAVIQMLNGTTTYSGTPTYTEANFLAYGGGMIGIQSQSWSGSVTGYAVKSVHPSSIGYTTIPPGSLGEFPGGGYMYTNANPAGYINRLTAQDAAGHTLGTLSSDSGKGVYHAGSVAANAGFALGHQINTTCTAEAASDVLAGLYINPTLDTGGQTGVSRFGIYSDVAAADYGVYAANNGMAGTFIGARSSAANFDQRWQSSEALTSHVHINVVTGDTGRVLTFSGNPTLGDWFNQAVDTGASPTFSGLSVLGAARITIDTGGTVDISNTNSSSPSLTVNGGEATHTYNGTAVNCLAEFHQGDTGDPTQTVFHAHSANDAQHGTIAILRGVGTHDAPVAVSDTGTLLGSIMFAGYDGTDYTPGALIEVKTDGKWTASSAPTKFILSSTEAGATTPTEHVTIDADGDVSIKNADLHIDDGAIGFFDGSTQLIGTIPNKFNGDVRTAIYKQTYDHSAQDTNGSGLAFSKDGTKMFILGIQNDSVFEYDLSTAWDVSTASYSGSSLSVNSQDNTPTDLYFKPDGTRFFVLGNTNDTVYQYSTGIPYDVSVASYDSKSFDVSGQSSGSQGLALSSDGHKMFIVDAGTATVYEYNLSTQWDVSTASYSGHSANITDTSPRGVAFTEDGRRIYYIGATNDAMFGAELTTPWDIRTLENEVSFSVSAQDTVPQAIAVKSDAAKIYITGNTNDSVFGYDLGIRTDGTVLAPKLDTTDSGAISIGGTIVLNDSGGTPTLSNISAIDATTEATIEALLGTAALRDTGTSGATVPLLSGSNTWSSTQTYTAGTTAVFSGSQCTFQRASDQFNFVTDRTTNDGNVGIAVFFHYGRNSTPAQYAFASWDVTIEDNTAASEDAYYRFRSSRAGSMVNDVYVGGGVCIGNSGVRNGQGTLVINQGSTTLAQPCLLLDQDDTDQEFIRFDGTSDTGSSSSVSSSATEANAPAGYVRININGTDRWLRFYENTN